MGIVQVTTRPSYYASHEAEKRKKKPEIVLTGKLSIRMEIGGLSDRLMRIQQKRIEKVVSSALREKGVYTREYNSGDDLGYYSWN